MLQRRRTPRDRAQAGLTLVEMMVSILLAAVLSAGLFYMTSGQQRTYTSQIDTLQLQESLWGAMEYLKRQVRLAGRGFGGCNRGKVYDGDPNTPSNATVHALRIFNGCNLTVSGASIDNSAAVDACTTSNPNSPDSFSITMRPEGSSPNQRFMTQVTRQPAGTSVILPVTSTRGFVVGEHVIVYPFGDTGRFCLQRRISALTPAAPPSLPFPTISTVSPTGATPPTNGFLPGTLVLAVGDPTVSLVPRYFAIDNSKGYPRLVTWTSSNATQPGTDMSSNYDIVAEGVEDMQISYACDVNDDDRLNEEQTTTGRLGAADEWFFNAPGTETLPDCQHRTPKAVRITLIARSRLADQRFKVGFRPAAEDRGAGTPANDRTISNNTGTYARRTLTVVVRPENMRQPRPAPSGP